MEKTKQVNAAVVIASLQKQAKPLISTANKITITDKASYELKLKKVKELKQILKIAEEKEASFIEPLKKLSRDIKEFFMPFYQLIDQLDKQTKLEMKAYIASTETKKLQVNNALAIGKIKKLSTAANKLADLDIPGGRRKIWVAEAVNEGLTPREYLVPDEVKIREALKAGKKVAGWKWVQVDSITI